MSSSSSHSEIRTIAIAVLVVLAFLFIGGWLDTPPANPAPECFEDEVGVTINHVWSPEQNRMIHTTQDTTVYCVAIDDIRNTTNTSNN